MEVPAYDLSDHLGKALTERASTLAEYYRIAVCSLMSDEDADRLDAIYQAAESDPWLNFLINELDYCINQRAGLLSDEQISDYDNQQAWLREHLQETPLDDQSRKAMQILLQEFNYYAGPIDGVLGKRSKKAIEKLHKKAQKLLAQKGYYHEQIDGIFAERSVLAVQNFQRAENIKDDGVLGKVTLTKLMN